MTSLLTKVYAGQRDVSHWVTDLTVEQPADAIHREWTVTLTGWQSVDPTWTWDIYGSYDPATPRAECLVRAGVVPPDRREDSITVRRGEAPSVTVRGVDQVWMAARRQPRQTVVIAPRLTDVPAALEDYDGPRGLVTVWAPVRTVHGAIRRLLAAAGMRTSITVPDVPLLPMVVRPDASYWDAAVELLRPWAPEVLYSRATRTILWTTPDAAVIGAGTTMSLSRASFSAISAVPSRSRIARRVLLRTRSPWS